MRSLLAAALAAALAACAQEPAWDLVVTGGLVIDGTGAEPRRADIGITGDRIVFVGTITEQTTASVIDASGKMVAPGFIDMLGHSGVSLLADGAAEDRLRQGVTTEILADRSPAFWTPTTADHDALRRAGVAFDWNGPTGYFNKVEARGTAVNVGTFVPSSAATGAVLATALRGGAWGIADDTGLSASELQAAADITGQNDSALVLPVESAVIATEAALLDIGARARRIVLSDRSTAPASRHVDSVIPWFVAANQRQIAAYGVVAPLSESAEARHVRDALRYGGVMVTGNFAHLLGPMVRDEHLMSLQEAVRRSTSMAASILKIPQRGIIRDNMFADIVIFDAATVADRPAAGNPRQTTTGIDYVIVNGVVVLTPRGVTGSRPGHRLLHAP